MKTTTTKKPDSDHRADGKFRKGNAAAQLTKDGFDHILRLGVTAGQLEEFSDVAKEAMAGRGIPKRHHLSQWARESLDAAARIHRHAQIAASPVVKPTGGMSP